MSEDENLDAALAEAFGSRAATPPKSVLERLRSGGQGGAPVLLREDAPGPPLASLPPELRGRVEGRYQVLGEIARGGVGVILKGHDSDLGRDVAMKVLREDHLGKSDVLQRFVEEAQIGGQLQHPGIVPVYELGLLADRRPFFTMKMVKGRTLAGLLRERAEPSTERRRFLSIFEAVCQTVAYAHSRGVVHRDLKPANVMVGSFGEVLVVDWGMGKVLRQGGVADERPAFGEASRIETVRTGSGSSHSVAGSLMGTPAYMPPEQARGEVEKLDERSDVFALGAILCEVLTGAPPYHGEAADLVNRAAQAELAPAFERLDASGADAELVAIAKDCLAPVPAARPRDAAALAVRIGGYLASIEDRARAAQLEAAESRAKAASERKARKLTAALAASVLLTVLGGGGTYLWIAQRRADVRLANEQSVLAALADAALARGQGDWNTAFSAAELAQGLARANDVSDELRERVEQVHRSISAEAAEARRRDELERDNAALIADLADIRQPERFTGSPWTWADVNRSYGEVFARHDLHVDEGNEVAVSERLGSRGIDTPLASTLDEWASVRRSNHDQDGAERLWRIADRFDQDPLRRRLRAAIAADDAAELISIAREIDAETAASATVHLLVIGLHRVNALPEGISVLRRARRAHPDDYLLAMDLARRLMQIDPQDFEESIRNYEAALALRPESFDAWHELGEILDRTGHHETAVEHFRAAIRRFPADDTLHRHLAGALELRGSWDESLDCVREWLARFPETDWAHERLVKTSMRAGRLEPLIAELRAWASREPSSFWAHCDLGGALMRAERLPEAIDECRSAIGLDASRYWPHLDLGIALLYSGLALEAIQPLRRATELAPERVDTHSGLGQALHATGNLDEAISEYRLAIASAYSNAAPQHIWWSSSDLAITHVNLALALSLAGRVDEAISAHARSIELDETSVFAHLEFGRTLYKAKQIEAAIREFRRTVELEPSHHAAHNCLAWLLATAEREDLRDPEQAIAHARVALDLRPDYAEGWTALGAAHYERGEHSQAKAALERAVEIGYPADTRGALLFALACQQLGEMAEAMEWFRRAEPGIEKMVEEFPEMRRFVDAARVSIGERGQ